MTDSSVPTGIDLIKKKIEEWNKLQCGNVITLKVEEKDDEDFGGKHLIIDNTYIISRDEREVRRLFIGGYKDENEMVNGFLIQGIVHIPATRMDPPDEDIVDISFHRHEGNLFKELVLLCFHHHLDGFMEVWGEEDQERNEKEWEKIRAEWDARA